MTQKKNFKQRIKAVIFLEAVLAIQITASDFYQ